MMKFNRKKRMSKVCKFATPCSLANICLGHANFKICLGLPQGSNPGSASVLHINITFPYLERDGKPRAPSMHKLEIYTTEIQDGGQQTRRGNHF